LLEITDPVIKPIITYLYQKIKELGHSYSSMMPDVSIYTKAASDTNDLYPFLKETDTSKTMIPYRAVRKIPGLKKSTLVP
jgi:hypothetical protein